MLLDEYVEINLTGNNIPRYEKLGYILPKVKCKKNKYVVKTGTKLKIKITDLPPMSTYKVKNKCDLCGEVKEIKYSTYYKKYSKWGECVCRPCSYKKYCSGENHHSWRNDLSMEERINGRHYYSEYSDFAKKVLFRDNYTCQCCKKQGGFLDVHHLNGYNWDIENRTNVSNGISLCPDCHENFHYHYGRGNNTKEQFLEWIGLVDLDLSGEVILPKEKQVYCFEKDKIYDNLRDACIDVKGKYEEECVNSIRKICNKKDGHHKYNGDHYFWYEEFEKMSKDELFEYFNGKSGSKKVILLDTEEVFDSVMDASRAYGIPKHKIIMSCKENSYCICKDNKAYSFRYYFIYLLNERFGD